MECCAPAKWKREEIPDHKFDYIDVDDFIDNSWQRQFSYLFVFVVTLKAILVYMADLAVFILLMASTSAFTSLFDSNTSQDPNANGSGGNNGQLQPGTTGLVCGGATNAQAKNELGRFFQANQKVTLGLIAASIVVSFVLLVLDWRKAMIIVRSRDISYAFTSVVAYRYYTIRSYAHYCFFSQIQNSRKTTDVVAFFVFFRFKGWKRLILAEFPRQFLNAINIWVALDTCTKDNDHSDVFSKYTAAYTTAINDKRIDTTKKAALILASITVTIWVFSALALLLAFFMYIPLLFTVQGNLKEYCVHKIDKRIGELLRRKSRKRIQEARKAEMKEIEESRKRAQTAGSVAGSEGNKAAAPLGLSQRPTLPDIDVDLDAGYDTYPKPPTQQAGSTYAPSLSGYGPGGAAAPSVPAVPGQYRYYAAPQSQYVPSQFAPSQYVPSQYPPS
eukprot:jgi/Hompol1/6735/HPOL_003746-RA